MADVNGNPTVIEITFWKKIQKIGESLEIPNKLDSKNNPLKEDFINYLEK